MLKLVCTCPSRNINISINVVYILIDYMLGTNFSFSNMKCTWMSLGACKV